MKSLVCFSERFGLEYDGGIMIPSHGTALCVRVKHYDGDSPSKDFGEGAGLGHLQLPQEGLTPWWT